jgi:hypothetical protein
LKHRPAESNLPLYKFSNQLHSHSAAPIHPRPRDSTVLPTSAKSSQDATIAALQFDPGSRGLDPAAPAFVPGPTAALELAVVHPLNPAVPPFAPGSIAARELALVRRLNPEALAFVPKLITALKADLKRSPTGTPPSPDFRGLPHEVFAAYWKYLPANIKLFPGDKARFDKLPFTSKYGFAAVEKFRRYRKNGDLGQMVCICLEMPSGIQLVLSMDLKRHGEISGQDDGGLLPGGRLSHTFGPIYSFAEAGFTITVGRC